MTILGVPFVWFSEAERARETVIEKLCSYPILRYFDVTRPVLFYTDASIFSIGGIPEQVADDGKEYASEFFSRSLRKHERNYSVNETELHAVEEAATRFRVYLASQKF